MGEEHLDLDRHSIEDVPGKLITVNGVTYVAKELLDEGAEAFVFPLTNVVSRLTEFVAKIYKFRPGTVEFEERTNIPANSGFFGSLLLDRVLHAEIYMIPGGMIRFQELVGGRRNAEYFHDQMEKASAAMKTRCWDEAAATYAEVLRKNPAHTVALFNLAACHLGRGETGDALELLARAKSIEPNDPSVYRQISNAHLLRGDPISALVALEETLRRFKWDLKTLRKGLQIAKDYGLVEAIDALAREVEGMSAFANGWPGACEVLVREVADARVEAVARQELADGAQKKQSEGNWISAIEIWERVPLRARASWELLNLAICKYRAGRFTESAEESLGLLTVLRSPARETAILIGLASSYKAGEVDLALKMVKLLGKVISNRSDLPTLPTMVLREGAVIEDENASMLSDLLSDINARHYTPEVSASIRKLLKLCRKRSVLGRPRWKFW